MNNQKESIQDKIDNDDGLQSKRKLLTIVSLILLGISFSGAEVSEANTFILKIVFTNQNGIAFLLLLTTVFLFIRYYSYSRPYHEKLFELWSNRLLGEKLFFNYNQHSFEARGLVYELMPKDILLEKEQDDMSDWSRRYRSGWLFKRYIDYEWNDNHGNEFSSSINLFEKTNFKLYLIILTLELKHWLFSFFTERENLDILAPYLLGVSAVLSFVFREHIQTLLGWFES
jgi:hypothetical protein